MTILIVGAGLSGLSLANFLKKNFLLIEKEKEPGGLIRSIAISGYTFDYCGHFLHWRSPEVYRLTKEILKDKFQVVERNSAIYEFDRFIPYPFQANLGYLPEKIRRECLLGLKKLSRRPGKNFLQWATANFGSGIVRHFFRPYNEKLWRIDLRKLTADWCWRFIPRVQQQKSSKKYGYNVYFIYPEAKGIGLLAQGLARHLKISLQTEVQEINWQKRYALLSDGRKIYYSYLINTSSLPDFLDRLINLPQEIQVARKKLKANAVYCLNLGTEKVKFSWHWIYFPLKKYPFYRLGVYSNVSPKMAPAGKSSIYIEWSRNPEEKFDYRQEEKNVQKILSEKFIGKIYLKHWLKIYPAYVIYDFERQSALKVIEKFLNENRIFSTGRYGRWQYSFMEEDILSAKKIADYLNYVPD